MMLNMEELLASLKRLEKLLASLKRLEDAAPCKVHGREHLHVCVENRCDSVRCILCEMPCQCWNDE